jgi:hypothetical protein
MLLFGIGAVVLVLVFVLVVGSSIFYLLTNGKTQVLSNRLPPGFPREVPLCAGFTPSRSFSTPQDGGTHFLVQGDCPENLLQLDDDLTRMMQYNGWTVHDDGQGSLSSYSYDRHARLDVGMTNDNSPANESAVQIDVWTGLTRPPDGFPSPVASASPR